MSALSGVFTVDVTSKKGSEAMDKSHRQIAAMRARLAAAPRTEAEGWEIEEAREEGQIDARRYDAPRSAPYCGNVALRAAYVAAWNN